MSQRRILITGASGNIGGELLPRLLPKPELEVVACYRTEAQREQFIAAGAKVALLDMDRRETIAPALVGIDALFLLKPYTINLLIQAKVLLDTARAAGVRHIVHVGAHGADDIPWAIIGWHHMVERYIEALGFSWTHLRPNFFMENLLKGSNRETGEIYHYLDGDRPVSWVSCRQIARAAASALTEPERYAGSTLYLADDSMSLNDVASAISSLSGRPYTYRKLPREAGFKAMTRLGREPEFVNAWLDYIAAINAGEVSNIDHCYSRPELGEAEENTGLEAFLAQHTGVFS